MAVAIQHMRWRWRLAIAGVIIVALVAVLATRGNAAQDSQYRTAVVDTGDVTQTLTASGSIESASRYDETFQVDGTVATVDVKEGDTVEAGQQLATLDDSDLQDAVSAAEDALTAAQNTLSDDLDAQANGTSSSSSGSSGGSSKSGSSTFGGNSGSGGSGGGSGTGGSGSGGSGSGGGGSGTSSAVKAAAQAVTDAQDALLAQYAVTTAALETASTARATAQTSCAAFAAITDPTDPDAAAALAQCQSDTATALADQQAAAGEQDTLMDLATALNDAVTALMNAINGTDSASPAAHVTSTGENTVVTVAAYTTSRVVTATDDFSGGDAAGGGSSNSSGVPSAEDILADEADVTAAKAALAVAEAQLEYATLTTPVAGKVVSVGFAEGDSVTAGDTSTAITVIADNTYVVNLSVSLTQAQMLAVGQAAKLALLSDNKVVDGTVSSVSTVNTGNSFSQFYAVKIAVPDPGFDIRIGTATRMSITVASATDVLVVPTSAVSDATGDATVQVIGDDGTAQTVSVTTGAVGSEYTEITDGLEKGQTVVLADLSFKLRTDDDSSSTGGLLSGLNDSSSNDQQFQGPGGGNFQPPDGFTGGGQGGGGFGGPPSG